MMIGTFNVQNQFYLKHYDGMNIQDNPKIFKDMLFEYQIDILGTQELVKRYLDHLTIKLKDAYQIVGDFRFSSPVFKHFKFNETNSIITRCPVLSHQTIWLPFLPTVTPRIISLAYIHTRDAGTICFMNTHLSYANHRVQKKQLKFIKNLISSIEVPIILTGDFNMTIHNLLLKQFIKDLETLHMKRIPINEKTFKKHTKNRSIDHIFIPEQWNIASYQVIKDKKFDHFSDHYLVLAEVYPKK